MTARRRTLPDIIDTPVSLSALSPSSFPREIFAICLPPPRFPPRPRPRSSPSNRLIGVLISVFETGVHLPFHSSSSSPLPLRALSPHRSSLKSPARMQARRQLVWAHHDEITSYASRSRRCNAIAATQVQRHLHLLFLSSLSARPPPLIASPRARRLRLYVLLVSSALTFSSSSFFSSSSASWPTGRHFI